MLKRRLLALRPQALKGIALSMLDDCSFSMYSPNTRPTEVLKVMAKAKLRLVKPSPKNRTVETPTRLANSEYRTREYLTEAEVAKLMAAAGKNRWGHRDSTMILACYRHGLRASELVDLQWSQVDFNGANLHVKRLKGSTDAVHPIRGDELRALRRLHREQEPKSSFAFTSERGSPFSTAGFLRMVQRAGEVAKLGLSVHPHMLRHATGFKLANDGVDTRTLQAYLGHKSINNTVRYTELSPTRFKDLWR
jgi:site-specific recombinase XerD